MSQSRDDIAEKGAFPLLLLEDRFPLRQTSMLKTLKYSAAASAGLVPLLSGAFSVMLVVVFEAMLSGKLAQARTGAPFDPATETFGVAIANICCGVVGGLPCTAALARTALNIKKGATSNVAGIINAGIVFIIVNFFDRIFRYLPMPFVASMMLFVTCNMPDWTTLRSWHANGELGLLGTALLVALTCVLADPGFGLLLGIATDTCRHWLHGPRLVTLKSGDQI